MASGGKAALASLEDPLVDRLAWRAVQRGFGAVVARAPRAAIDCNRGEDEVDPAVIDGARRSRVTARARGGLGIVPARTQQHERHDAGDFELRTEDKIQRTPDEEDLAAVKDDAI